jgi:hypothetical protein
MKMRARFVPVVLSVLLGLSLAACDQKTEPAQTDSGVPDDSGTVPGLKITVSYQGSDNEVDLSTLSATTLGDGSTAVALSDIVLAALPGKDLATVNSHFTASDGFDPSTKANCAAVLPVTGDLLAQGFVDTTTANLSWADALQLPGCAYVKGLAQVRIADAGLKVTVTYASVDHMVDVSTITAETSGLVLVSNVVLKALPGTDLATLNTNFLGADGYDPSTKANCQPVLPVPGENLAQGFIDPATLNLTWDAALTYPGCLKVDGLGQILLTDK